MDKIKNQLRKIKEDISHTWTHGILSTKTNRIIWVVLSVLIIWVAFLIQDRFQNPPYERLVELFQEGKSEDVIKRAESYLKSHETDEALHILLARAYLAYGISIGKRDEYGQKAIDLLNAFNLKTPLVLNTKALVYYALHNNDGARLAYKETLNIDARNGDATVGLAKIFESEKKYDEALDLYSKALTLKVSNFDAEIGVLRIKIIKGENDYVFERLNELVKTVNNQSYLASIYEMLATEYGRRKDYDNAKKMYMNVLAFDSDRIASLTGLADVYVKTIYKEIGKEGNTIAILTKKPEELALLAIKQDSQFIYAYLVLFDIERIRGNNEKAGEYEKKINELLKSGQFSTKEKAGILVRLIPLSKATVKVNPPKK